MTYQQTDDPTKWQTNTVAPTVCDFLFPSSYLATSFFRFVPLGSPFEYRQIDDDIPVRYRVIHKKLSHETEDKMQEKMKMILQVDENLAHL